ncbi:MAG: Cof-type HAD-IIB family hydrolase [Thermoflexaceae bacterium]|nr:Cof-type HAD-IIB family hydrolase [Thermoflexaceae bacterium]
MIRAIALDIDGTILNSRKQITDATKKAVKEALARGIKIIIASGRPYSGVEEHARELGLFEMGGYALCFNGSRIVDCRTEEIVYDMYLKDDEKWQICDILKQYEKGIIMTYKDRILLTENAENEGVRYGAMLNRLNVCQVDDMRKHIDYKVNKFILAGEPDYIQSIASDVKEKIGELATVCRSETTLLEIMPRGVDKGSALAGFLQNIGIRREELLAVGDGYNDDTMIEYAGIGVAMGNAFPEIKNLADYVTCSNDEDGVALAIRKFAFGENVDEEKENGTWIIK